MNVFKKIVVWAVKNEWIDKNPFIGFQLKFKRCERDFLQVNELALIEAYDFDFDYASRNEVDKVLFPEMEKSRSTSLQIGEGFKTSFEMFLKTAR